MADGNSIHLDDERAAKLKALADMADMSPEDYAALLIDRDLDQALLRTIDPDPAIDRAIIDHAMATGQFRPWSEVRDRLLARHRR
ncbi:antitoxin [Caulobacter soli]|uniref:antitoxin n=1 Tax=Caulobacter soli TaxID=2708539 RepID=UPI0013EDE451|nr:antitoxin [Caulobacter soli]